MSRALTHLRAAADVAGLGVEEVALPADRDVVVHGLRLHYLDWGGGDRQPLVFLHGGGLTARTWDLVCLVLRRDFRCLALDLRGHGDSEWSPALDYMPEAHARDVRGFVAALGLTRPVLVGQSLGGLAAVMYAQASSEPDGVVLVDIAPGVRASGVRRVKDFLMDEPAEASVAAFVERARAFNPRRDRRLLERSILHNLRQLPDGRWTWKYDRRGLTDEYVAAVERRLERLRETAERVRCPVLIVRGAESDVVSETAAARFAAAFPDARWTTVANAGHTVQGDNPAALADVLKRFLARIGHTPSS